MTDIACIGILVADIIAKPVDKIPGAGLLERISSIGIFSGGCAMNTGLDLAKMGLKAAVLGKIGEDSLGDFLEAELIRHNIDVRGISKDGKLQTSASVVLSSASGERSFLHTVGANAGFSAEDINYDVIADSDIVFVGGTMLMDSFDGEDCAKVLKKCREMGKTTVLDTAWDSKGRWMKLLAPCMPYIDYFIPSIDEAIELSGKKAPEEIADVFFDMGVKKTVIKLGTEGCYGREEKNGEGIYVPSYRVDAVDTTGAGDSFCAGFLAGLSKGLSFKDSMRFANATGAHCVMSMGASTGIKPYGEIYKFMEEN